MKARKSGFFIAAILILLTTYIALFGLTIPIGRYDVIIKGAPNMRFGIDIRGGVDAVFQPKDLGRAPTEDEMDATRSVIETRLDQLNILDREVTVDNQNGYIFVRFPWKSDETNFDPEKAIAELGQTAKLTFRDPSGNVILDGSHVTKSVVEYVQQDAQYEVSLKFDDEGTTLFANATAAFVGQKISIYMDDNLISAPTVEETISSGEAYINNISGGMEEAKDLANKIAAGALPFSMESKNHSVISPTLGSGALEVMIQAGAAAFILICLFLLFYYRLPGFIACLALMLQVAGQLLALSLPQITLTLPGIAAVILSIGMGVDANIIISERIREEMRSGKTLDSAISAGFQRAFSSVFDGNITVMIVAIILMIFGSGSLLSFAYSLLTGVMLNFLAGVTTSRIMIRSISQFKFFRKPGFYMKRGAKQ